MNRIPLNQSADHLCTGVLRDQLRKLSDAPVIKVKTREKGITSGERQRCYWNANLCAQSFGGEPVYGWMINLPTDETPGITTLVGHACWVNPEGVVVNTTLCDDKEILFLPSSTVLQLNVHAYQEIPDLFFLDKGCDFDVVMQYVASDSYNNIPIPISSLDLFWGSLSMDDIPIQELFFPRFFLNEHVDKLKYLIPGTDFTPDKDVVRTIFSPHIETRSDLMSFHSHQPGVSFPYLVKSSTRSLTGILKYFAESRMHLRSLLYRDLVRRDAEDRLKGEKFYLVNRSTQSHKFIHQIPPCETLLEQMIPRGKKKKLRKYEKVASENNLSVQELLLMNDPRYIPHPYLINKSKRVVRV